MKYLPAIAGALLLASRRKGKIRSEPKTVIDRRDALPPSCFSETVGTPDSLTFNSLASLHSGILNFSRKNCE